MSGPAQRLAAAETGALAARARLNASIAELQQRLDPRLLAGAAAEQGRQVGRTVRRNPAPAAASGALVAALLLRRPLMRLLRRRPSSKHKDLNP